MTLNKLLCLEYFFALTAFWKLVWTILRSYLCLFSMDLKQTIPIILLVLIKLLGCKWYVIHKYTCGENSTGLSGGPYREKSVTIWNHIWNQTNIWFLWISRKHLVPLTTKSTKVFFAMNDTSIDFELQSHNISTVRTKVLTSMK